MSSVVQMQGLIHLLWAQEASKFSPKPDIISRYDPTYEATKLHLEDMAERYDNPIAVLKIKSCKTTLENPHPVTVYRVDNLFEVNEGETERSRAEDVSEEGSSVIDIANTHNSFVFGDPMSTLAVVFPTAENQVRAGEGRSEANSHSGDCNRKKQKINAPTRDLSIQVLEKFSLVTKFARDTTSQLFSETVRRTFCWAMQGNRVIVSPYLIFVPNCHRVSWKRLLRSCSSGDVLDR